MRIGALVVLACACGSKSPEPATIKPPPPVKAGPTPEAICQRFGELVAEDCGNFGHMNVQPAQCPEVFQMALAAPDTKDGRVLTAMGGCMVDHPTCKGVLLCIATIPFDDPHDLRACTDPADSRAVGVDAARWQARNGAGVTRYAAASSTKEHPIETCGISAGLDWLVGLACADGSHPLRSRDAAEAARLQNVGRGGACGSIIDLYRVTCPEATYDIYLDGYVCPLP